MNRKLFNGLLLLTVATGGIGTFTSCKDTEQDFRNEVLVGQQDLSAQIAAIRNFTDPDFKKNLDDFLAAKDYASAADLVQVWAAIDAAKDRMDKLEQAYKDADDALKAELENKIATDIEALREQLEGYTDAAVQALAEQLEGVKATAEDALEQALFNAGEIERIQQNLAVVQSQVATLEGELADLQEQVNGLEEKYADLLDQLAELEENFDNRLNGLEDQLEEFRNEVEDMFSRLKQMMAKWVTGIIVQEAYNPVFGTFNLPIGLQNSMLVNYYAYFDKNDVVFPNAAAPNKYEYSGTNVFGNGDDETAVFTLPELKGEPFKLAPKTYMLESLGNLYVTVNPIDRDFTDLKFSIVNSQNEAIPGEFKLANTDHVKTFGAGTRGETGLYVADIKPASDNDQELIEAVRFDIEDGLKSNAKDFIKDPSKAGLMSLAKALYDQFDNKLPAYGAKVSWVSDSEEDANGNVVNTEKAVVSNYDLAVTTFRPLTYTSAEGEGLSRDILPTFGSLESIVTRVFNSIKGRLQIGLTGVDDFDKVTITIDSLKFDLKFDKLTVHIPAIKVDLGEDIEPGYTEPTDIELTYYDGELQELPQPGEEGYDPNNGALNPLIDAIKDAVEGMISDKDNKNSLINQINDQINTEIIAQVNKMIRDIDDQLTGVQGKIDGSVDAIRDRILAELNGGRAGEVANRLWDLYNSLAERINNFIKNPNAYFQVMMAYMGQDNMLHHLSTNMYDATRVARGGNLELFMTSYSAELIVPSFKKYVAVTKAFERDANGNLVETSLDSSANNSEFLNTVLPGRQQRNYISTDDLKSGVTYEILYQSLDYRGATSSRLYYITVE